MKRSLEKTLYILTPLVIFTVVSFLLNFIDRLVLDQIACIGQAAAGFIRDYGTTVSTVAAMINTCIELLVMHLLMKRDPNELSVWDYLNLNGQSFYRSDKYHSYGFAWTMVVVIGISGSIGLNVLIGLTGLAQTSQGYSEASASLYSAPIWIGLPYVVVFSPVIEEMIYRLLIYGRLKRNFPVWIAMVVSSLFFGIMHGNAVQGIYAFLMGILMCLAVEYTHSIWGSLIMHSAANLVIYILSWSGVLIKMNNITCCIIFMGILFIAVGLMTGFSVKTKKKQGIPLGVTPVGCFFIDE